MEFSGLAPGKEEVAQKFQEVSLRAHPGSLDEGCAVHGHKKTY